MLRLNITSDSSTQDDRELIQASRDLYLDLKLQMDEGDIKPDTPDGVAQERFGLELFQQLIVTGVSLGVFGGMFNVVKLWLDNRPTCEVTLTYPDGFQMKVSKISLEEAKKLHEEHARSLRG